MRALARKKGISVTREDIYNIRGFELEFRVEFSSRNSFVHGINALTQVLTPMVENDLSNVWKQLQSPVIVKVLAVDADKVG